MKTYSEAFVKAVEFGGRVVFRAVRASADLTSGKVETSTILIDDDEMPYNFETFHHAFIVADRYNRGPETDEAKWDKESGVWVEMGRPM